MPGGAAAIRQPWRMAAAYLAAAFPAGRRAASTWRGATRPLGRVLAVARRGVNAPLTSSAGRLFDAAAAVLGVRDAINYEGQAAIELEQLADPGTPGGYPAAIDGGPTRSGWPGADLIRAAVAETCGRGAAGGRRGPVPPRAWRR